MDQPPARVLEPFQWDNFKLRYPNSVGIAGEAPPIAWSSEIARQIGGINARVNTGIKPKADSRGTLDTWDIWPALGDCNDYAVTKRSELLKVGYPASVLLLEEVKCSNGVGHLILNLRTDRGLIVLDNLTSAMMDRGDTDYTRVMMQSDSNPEVWTD